MQKQVQMSCKSNQLSVNCFGNFIQYNYRQLF